MSTVHTVSKNGTPGSTRPSNPELPVVLDDLTPGLEERSDPGVVGRRVDDLDGHVADEVQPTLTLDEPLRLLDGRLQVHVASSAGGAVVGGTVGSRDRCHPGVCGSAPPLDGSSGAVEPLVSSTARSSAAPSSVNRHASTPATVREDHHDRHHDDARDGRAAGIGLVARCGSTRWK